MFDTVCTLPLSAELFDQAVHPTEPILSVGLASGQVRTFRLPTVDDGSSGGQEHQGYEKPKSGNLKRKCSGSPRQLETLWSTRRHPESCRALSFDADGRALISAGTEGIVKVADVESGRVAVKIALPHDRTPEAPEPAVILHALSPQTLIVGTDLGTMLVYDLRAVRPGPTSERPQATHRPHADYISSITPLPASATSTSGFSRQWVSTGATTVAVTDVRRGVLAKSATQEDELLSSVLVHGLSRRGTSVGEKLLVGTGSGVLTLWERGVWDDQDERIIVDPTGDSLDSLALVPDGVLASEPKRLVVAGLGDGTLRLVRLGPNKVIHSLTHDDTLGEPVVGLGFDVSGRLISGGGSIIKVWQEKLEGDGDGLKDDYVPSDGFASKDGVPDDAESDGDGSAATDAKDAQEDTGAQHARHRRKRKRRKGQGMVGVNGDGSTKGVFPGL